VQARKFLTYTQKGTQTMSQHIFFATVTGNITREPELKYTAQGVAILTVNVAVNTGAREAERTTWLRVSIWRNYAEMLAKHLKKGMRDVTFIGRVENREYTDKNGEKRYSLEMTAEHVSGFDWTPKDQQQPGGDSAPASADDALPETVEIPF
jgi:single-strand DNA-binding protein